MPRCDATKELFGIKLRCTREWDDHGTGHAFHATVPQTKMMLGKTHHVKTMYDAQLELRLSPIQPPDSFTSR